MVLEGLQLNARVFHVNFEDSYAFKISKDIPYEQKSTPLSDFRLFPTDDCSVKGVSFYVAQGQ